MAGSNIIHQCLEKVDRLKKDNVLTPVYIIVPDNEYRHAINKGVYENKKCYLNLHVKTLQSFIREKTEIQLMLSGKRLIDSLESVSMLRHIIDNLKLEYFEEVKQFASIPELFNNTIRNIRLAGDEKDMKKGLPNLPDPLKGADILEIYEQYCAYLQENDFLDYRDLLDMFLKSAKGEDKSSHSSGNPQEHIILFPWIRENLSYIEQKCLEHMEKEFTLTELEEQYPGTKLEFFIDAFESVECTTIARKIIKLAEASVPFDTIAVVCPNHNYISIMADALHQAQIPCYLPQGILSNHLDSFRFFRVLVDIYTNDYAFEDIKKYLLLNNNYYFLSFARKYGAAKGYENWLDSLKINMEDKDNKKAATHIAKLLEFIKSLGTHRGIFKEEHTTSGYIEKFIEIIEEFIPKSQNRGILSNLIRRLYLPGLKKKIAPDEFIELIYRKIDHYYIASENHEGSVCVTTTLNPGIYDHAFAPGLVEKNYPKPFRQDPVLLDTDIEILNSNFNLHLETSISKKEKEERKFDILLKSANEKITLSYPYMDVIEGREIFYTPFFYKVYEKIFKKEFNYSDVKEYIRQKRSEAYIFPKDPKNSLTEMEYETGRIFKKKDDFSHYISIYDNVKNSYLSEQSRWRIPEFNAFTGIINKNCYSADNYLSATRIGDFLACPYKYFLKYVMDIKPVEEPALADNIDVLQMGGMVHDILEAFMSHITKNRIPPDEYDKTMKQFRDEHAEKFIKLIKKLDKQVDYGKVYGIRHLLQLECW